MSGFLASRTVALLLFAGCIAGGDGRCDEKSKPDVLAHFKFDGDAKDVDKARPEFKLKNTEFKDNALYLNGKYVNADKTGYEAQCETPKFDYKAFTVAMRFKAEDFSGDKRNLLTGGPALRWFSLRLSPLNGNLMVRFNNGRFNHEIKGVKLEKGEWTVIACGVDVATKKAVVHLNGKEVAAIDLPKDFGLDVAGSVYEQFERIWSFTDGGTGTVFHGLVDELIIYNRMLTADEFAKIPLRP